GPRGEENLAPATVQFLHHEPMVYVNTAQGGALYASDSVQTAVAAFKLVYDFGADSLGGDSALTPDDRWYVEALTGKNRLVALDRAPGHLGCDGGFRDELSGGVGVDFNRQRWPHGDTGPARPHGLAFLTPEPPPPEEGRHAPRP